MNEIFLGDATVIKERKTKIKKCWSQLADILSKDKAGIDSIIASNFATMDKKSQEGIQAILMNQQALAFLMQEFVGEYAKNLK